MSITRMFIVITLLTSIAACDPEPVHQPDPMDPQDQTDPPDPEGPSDPELPAGSVPEALIGTWSDGVSSPTTFWDEGQYAGNATEQAIIFTFDASGAYGQYVYNAVNSYGCWLKTWSLFEGAAVAEDGVLSLEPVRGRYQIRSNCNADSNYDRDAVADEVAAMASVWSWEVDGRSLALWQEGWDAPYLLELHEE